jgi:hypothetical protein
MKREIKHGQGFICETLEETKRLWQKLTDAGYPMSGEANQLSYNGICFFENVFFDCWESFIFEILNESDFFKENEWTPKPGELVEVSDNGIVFDSKPRVFACEYKNRFYCEKLANDSELQYWKHIRQIKPETMTLQEAQEKLREVLGNPKLTIEP